MQFFEWNDLTWLPQTPLKEFKPKGRRNESKDHKELDFQIKRQNNDVTLTFYFQHSREGKRRSGEIDKQEIQVKVKV